MTPTIAHDGNVLWRFDRLYGAMEIDIAKPHASEPKLFGCQMVFDPSLPRGVIEFRDSNGKVYMRIVEDVASPAPDLFDRIRRAIYGC